MFTDDWKKQLQQSDKKETLTNNQDKKYKKFKKFKSFKSPSPCWLFLKMNCQARITLNLKAFFLQPIGKLNYSSERFLSSCSQINCLESYKCA